MLYERVYSYNAKEAIWHRLFDNIDDKSKSVIAMMKSTFRLASSVVHPATITTKCLYLSIPPFRRSTIHQNIEQHSLAGKK